MGPPQYKGQGQQEDRCILLLQELEDAPQFFLDVKLRDWRSTFALAKVWVSFGPDLQEAFQGELGQALASKQEAAALTAARTAIQIAIRAATGPDYWVQDIDLNPLDDLAEEGEGNEGKAKDAFVYLWLFGEPDKKTLERANKTSGAFVGRRPEGMTASQAKKLAEESERLLVGGRPSYAIRAPGFYDDPWGEWLPHPKAKKLMEFLCASPPHSSADAKDLAKKLNERPLTTLSGKKFSAASVRRLDVWVELLLGNKKPGP